MIQHPAGNHEWLQRRPMPVGRTHHRQPRHDTKKQVPKLKNHRTETKTNEPKNELNPKRTKTRPKRKQPTEVLKYP